MEGLHFRYHSRIIGLRPCDFPRCLQLSSFFNWYVAPACTYHYERQTSQLHHQLSCDDSMGCLCHQLAHFLFRCVRPSELWLSLGFVSTGNHLSVHHRIDTYSATCPVTPSPTLHIRSFCSREWHYCHILCEQM